MNFFLIELAFVNIVNHYVVFLRLRIEQIVEVKCDRADFLPQSQLPALEWFCPAESSTVHAYIAGMKLLWTGP